MTNNPKANLDFRFTTPIENTLFNVDRMLDDMARDMDRNARYGYKVNQGIFKMFQMTTDLVKCLRIQQVEIITLCRKINKLEGKDNGK